jgi:hypothetical protein
MFMSIYAAFNNDFHGRSREAKYLLEFCSMDVAAEQAAFALIEITRGHFARQLSRCNLDDDIIAKLEAAPVRQSLRPGPKWPALPMSGCPRDTPVCYDEFMTQPPCIPADGLRSI